MVVLIMPECDGVRDGSGDRGGAFGAPVAFGPPTHHPP